MAPKFDLSEGSIYEFYVSTVKGEKGSAKGGKFQKDSAPVNLADFLSLEPGTYFLTLSGGPEGDSEQQELIVPGYASGYTVTVFWQPNPSEDNVHAYIIAANGFTIARVSAVESDYSFFSGELKLRLNTEYAITVAAENATGQGPYSDPAMIRINGDQTVQALPSKVQGVYVKVERTQ